MNQSEVTPLSASLEDYLEAIIHLEKANRDARVKEIAEFLSVKMPSVTGALKVLKKKGLVDYEKNSYIRLTEQGASVASSITAKHKVLIRFLRRVLQLSEDKAYDMACRMEHVIDDETEMRLQLLIETFENNVDQASWEKKITSISK